MRFLKILGIIVLIIVVFIIAAGLLAPTEYDISRSITIDAPKELIFRHVKYWTEWQAWSPWAEMDSTMTVSYEGTDGEVGSIYKWEGDPKLTGKGMMTNTGVTEFGEITYHLRFMEPWESESDGFVSLEESEGGILVTWGYYGNMKFPWNVAALFMNMDKSMGRDFNQGLQKLKEICEKEKEIFAKFPVKEIDYPATKFAMIRKEMTFEEMHQFFTDSYTELYTTLGMKRIQPVGAPSALYYTWDKANNNTEIAAAVPVRTSVSTDMIETITLPASRAIMVDYMGPYEQLVHGHNALDLYLAQNDLEFVGPGLEVYVTDPENEEDPAKWLTKIYYFVSGSD